MIEDMMWMKLKWMHKNVMTDFLMSISFSVFGMLLIFGLGFVFPNINPYVVIKWILIVAAVVFAFSFLKYLAFMGLKIKVWRTMKGEWKQGLKAKKTSKK